MKKIKLLLFFLLASLANYLFANNFPTPKNYLPPEQVFKVEAKLESATHIRLMFSIEKGFYAYYEKFSVSSNHDEDLIKPIKFPRGFVTKVFDGEKYVDEEVLTNKFSVNVFLKKPIEDLILTVNLQGCDGVSICYPPQEYKFNLRSININKQENHSQGFKDVFSTIYYGKDINSKILDELNLLEISVIFLIAGIIIALTPCMYPLYPIALSTIVGVTTIRRARVPLLVITYIHGMALIYVLVGIIAALSGKLITTLIQSPVLIIIASLILLTLGLAMFDLFEIKLPANANNYLHRKLATIKGGRYAAVFVMGILSALLLGPCITPPLIILIGFIASSGDLLVGGLGLYAISLGMGTPIIILATLGDRVMPRSGIWMNWLKNTLGLLIIILAIYLAYPFMELGNPFLNISVLCFSIALVFLIIKHLRKANYELLVHKVMPILMIIAGLLFMFYGTKSQTHEKVIIQNKQNTILVVNEVEEVQEIIKTSSNKPLIILISAKWCSVCREMDEKTFTKSNIEELNQRYTLIKFDITSNKKEYYIWMRNYDLYGPPAILLFNTKKQLKNRLVGFIDYKRLTAEIAKLED